MKINVSIGVTCTNCNLTIGTLASGDGNCPECGGEMIASKKNETRTIANFKCSCGCQIGHMSVIGSEIKCPSCGKIS